MNTDINEMDTHQIDEELNQWFNEAERTLDIPKDWICTFGKWHQLKDFMESVLWEYEQIADQIDEEREERQEAEGARLEMVRGIQDIMCDIEIMENSDDMDSVYQMLNKLVSGESIKPVKQKRKSTKNK